MTVRTRYTPTYTPHETNPTISGYNVYTYVGHPLLGQIEGTKQHVKTKTEAQRIAHQLSKQFTKESK